MMKHHIMDITRLLGKIIFILVIGIMLRPDITEAEFYKYRTKEGKTVYVDDKSMVPEEYLDQLETYQEKYDHLPGSEKKEREQRDLEIQKDMEENERSWMDENLRREQERERAEKMRQEQLAREKMERGITTKVEIVQNRILVPVTLGYSGNEVQTTLILDTGATLTVLHKEIADQLGMTSLKAGSSQVAGGSVIRSDLGRLSYLKVGEITMKDPNVLIIGYEGPPTAHSGLLGMNFLRNFEYRIDYREGLIRWNLIQ
jgi:predicted aspartyl protease